LASIAGIWNRIGQTLSVWSEEKNAMAKWITANTKRKSVFWAPVPQIWWNPAVVRAGRVAWIGYQSTLQDFVIDNSKEVEVIDAFLERLDERIPVDYFLMPRSHEVWKKFVNCSILEVVYEEEELKLFTWKKVE
jgi:hypothetical protein